ncbi:RNA processing protein Grc3 [Paracoccidioides lutzii Pb01]|uniref:Polynucleotide 5'-hydroxyl-kinase GRC3 n=1 Tax=Paracoccidioides lutzii (strain ATCC MYA-826 / Pb01) TaxID=502779 RepID=C1H9H3_PARBA|nr:RNA processing protein Grc3 [Paracoccidioides lutzii Pb01]EEH36996.2 RNA processing protein Grc3 [Paracoccidioides lutzii Pb01]
MKRKGEMQSQSAPVSAFAARRSRQKSVAVWQTTATVPESILSEEPPLKRTKTSSSRCSSRDHPDKRPLSPSENITIGKSNSATPALFRAGSSDEICATQTAGYQSGSSDEDDDVETEVSSDDQESDAHLTNAPADFQNFLLSKSRLCKSSVIYRTDKAICIRLKLKMVVADNRKNLALIGQYDLWVKRGVVSIMGAKLHPSPRLYRVYAPSTHSLPVIKCVSGVDGYAEVEIRSCNNGLYRLKNLSNLYHRICNSKKPVPGSVLQTDGSFSFSILHSSSDDPLKRHLRPLHLDKKWSTSIQTLSQRGAALRVLTCGPKGSGKSTFNKYLLNHLLSLPPTDGSLQQGKRGVAFLDLDPGQPELSPMGQVYLACLHTPILGPPFSHPTIDSPSNGYIIRSHYIGASSPKDNPDHYIVATMDLMNRYHKLLQSYPQCPLVINYPGWIFGLGLEIVLSFLISLGLSDVVYMSNKGPAEVVEPLIATASEAGVLMTILPSQPTDFVTRSSAQLRSMQMISYFHSTQYRTSERTWSDIPLCLTRPVTVNYAGTSPGILGIMVTGSHHGLDMLSDLLDGAVVGIVAIESLNAIAAGKERDASDDNVVTDHNGQINEESNLDPDGDLLIGTNVTLNKSQSPSSPIDPPHPSISRTPDDNLPHLFVGDGACTPLDPSLSYCLGQAIIRSVNPQTQTLDLYTPIPPHKIRDAVEQGHHIILVRGQVDNPNWAISEEYFCARAAQRRYRRMMAKEKAEGIKLDTAEREKRDAVSERLRERVRRAGNVPWMSLNERARDAKENSVKNMWRLWKKAYPADSRSGSDKEW